MKSKIQLIFLTLLFSYQANSQIKTEYIIAQDGRGHFHHADFIIQSQDDIGVVINDAINNGHKSIKIMPGEYIYSTTININQQDVQIIGSGLTYLIYNTSPTYDGYAINVTSHGATLRDLKIDPIHSWGAIRLLSDSQTSTFGISNCLFENLTIGKQNIDRVRGSDAAGIVLAANTKPIEFNTFKNIVFMNVPIPPGSNSNSDPDVVDVNKQAIYLNASNSYIGNNTFENIKIKNWTECIEFAESNNTSYRPYFDNHFSNFKIQTGKFTKNVVKNVEGDNNSFKNFYLNDWRNTQTNTSSAEYVISVTENARWTVIDNFQAEANVDNANDQYTGYYIDEGLGTRFTNGTLNGGTDFIYNSTDDFIIRGDNSTDSKFWVKNMNDITFNDYNKTSFLGEETLFAPVEYTSNEVKKYNQSYLKSLVTIENIKTNQPLFQANISDRTKINIPNRNSDNVDLIVGNHFALSSTDTEKLTVYGSVYSTLGDYVIAPVVKNNLIFNQGIENIDNDEIFTFLEEFEPVTYKNENTSGIEFRNSPNKNISLTASTNVSWLESTDPDSPFSNVVKRSVRTIGSDKATFINFDMITSLLVGAVNELKEENDDLKNRLDDIESRLDALVSSNRPLTNDKTISSNKNSELGILHQNTPNPFNSSTSIKYYVPRNNIQAKIIFTNSAGKIIASENVNSGEGDIDFSNKNLASGIYYYSLYVGEKLIDTKKMIIK